MKTLDKAGGYNFPYGIEIDGICFIHTLIKRGTQGCSEFIGLVTGKDQLLAAVQSNAHIHHHGSAFAHWL
jgi:hypothetical protein